MKKFSLKKITAAVSAAAMIATMGTTAFADTVGISGSAISLTKVEAKQNADGTYDVTIEYKPTGENANEIGVTMLAYGGVDKSGIKETNPVNGAEVSGNEYKSGMQIVGVDQNKVTGNENNENKFTFKVTTAENAGGYYVKAGKSALVMVSGDKTSPAVAELRFNKEITSGDAITELSGITGTVAEGTSATKANLQAAAKSAVEAVIPDAEVTTKTVTYTEGETKATVSYDATVPANTEFRTVEKLDGKTDSVYYKNTSDSAIEKEGTVEVSYATTDASGVTDASQAITIAKKEVTTESTEAGTVDIEKIKSEIKNRKAELKNEDGTLTDKIALTNADVTDVTPKTGETNKYTAKVKLTSGEGEQKLLKVPERGIEYDVDITLTSKNVISAISLDNSGIPGKVEVQVDTEGATPTKEAVEAKLPTVESLADKSATYDTGKTAAFSNFAYDWQYDSTNNKAKLVVTGFAETADTTITNDYMFANAASIVVAEVIVTTKVKPAFKLGDVDRNNVININDASLVYNYYFKIGDYQLDEEQLGLANVNTDDVVNVADAAEIYNYYFKIGDYSNGSTDFPRER